MNVTCLRIRKIPRLGIADAAGAISIVVSSGYACLSAAFNDLRAVGHIWTGIIAS